MRAFAPSRRRAGRRGLLVVAAALAAVAALAGLASCGSRTGLGGVELAASDGAPDLDGSGEAAPPFDAPRLADARPDEGAPDVRSAPRCPNAGATPIYVLTGEPGHAGFRFSNTLYSFEPASASFKKVGTPVCESRSIAKPNSLTVDRAGLRFISFTDGDLDISKTGKWTTCVPAQHEWLAHCCNAYGMGFVAVGAGERLFISLQDSHGGPDTLSTIDTRRFTITTIGSYSTPLTHAELTGTGDGRLYALTGSPRGVDGFVIDQIDPDTAVVLHEYALTGVTRTEAYAFAFWGGDFFTFTESGEDTAVHRFDPTSGDVQQVATLPNEHVVAAGVSTCAPLGAP